MSDYYKILGINKGAADSDIKKAFHKLAHKYHPDKSSGDEKKFKEIVEAYSVLSDKNKREQYDKFGRVFEGAQTANQGPFGAGQGPFGGGFGFEFDPSAFSDASDLGDIFEAFFEGMGVKQKRRTYQRGADVEVVQEITLEEAFFGVKRELAYKINIICDKCSGKGHDVKEGFDKCSVCAGRGEIKETRNTFFGSFAQVKQCNECFGTGQIPKKICSHCKGAGRIIGEQKAKIDILPGIADNQIIKIQGMGEAGERGVEGGDLYVRIKIKSHPVFSRFGNDLLIKKEIKLVDILLEEKIEAPTISGDRIKVEIPENFNLKENLVIPKQGMPVFGGGWRSGRGNLIIELKIKTPKKASAKAKKILEDFKKEID